MSIDISEQKSLQLIKKPYQFRNMLCILGKKEDMSDQ